MVFDMSDVSPFARSTGDWMYNQAKSYAKDKAYKAAVSSFSGKTKKKKRTKRAKPSGSYMPDGSSAGRTVVAPRKTKKRKPGRSLKKRISALERNKPKDSFKFFDTMFPLKIRNNVVNSYGLHSVKVCTTGKLEQSLTLNGVDFGAKNTSVKIQNRWGQVSLKNAMTANVDVQYFWVSPKDHDAESFCEDLMEEYTDRGLGALLPTRTAEQAATATASLLPEQIRYTSVRMNYPKIHSNATDKAWKIGKVSRVSLGPGDTVRISQSFPDILYKVENFDQEPFTYQVQNDQHLMIVCYPQLSHDASNHDVVAYGDYALDCTARLKYIVRYNDGEALKEEQYESTMDGAGFSTAHHVDNTVSAVETDAE